MSLPIALGTKVNAGKPSELLRARVPGNRARHGTSYAATANDNASWSRWSQASRRRSRSLLFETGCTPLNHSEADAPFGTLHHANFVAVLAHRWSSPRRDSLTVCAFDIIKLSSELRRVSAVR
jgi:hypothetical protein